MQEVFGFSGKKMKWMCLCYLPRNRKFMPLCNYDSTWLNLLLMLVLASWKGKFFGLLFLKWLNYITFPGFCLVILIRHFVAMIS